MDVDAFILHGVSKSFYDSKSFEPFIGRIKKHLGVQNGIVFHPIDYSHLLSSKEETILSWMKGDHYQHLRGFGCNFVCDVLAYAYPKRPPQEGDFIYDVTKLLADKFAKVCVQRPASKKVLICHSLGCIVGFGFSWDVKIDGLLTFGNPFDYFSIRFKNFGQSNPNLPLFINFHDPFDPISTRVGRNPNFADVTDVLVFNWNPLKKLPIRAHLAYWENDAMCKKIAGILKALPISPTL